MLTAWPWARRRSRTRSRSGARRSSGAARAVFVRFIRSFLLERAASLCTLTVSVSLYLQRVRGASRALPPVVSGSGAVWRVRRGVPPRLGHCVRQRGGPASGVLLLGSIYSCVAIYYRVVSCGQWSAVVQPTSTHGTMTHDTTGDCTHSALHWDALATLPIENAVNRRLRPVPHHSADTCSARSRITPPHVASGLWRPALPGW